MIDIPYAYVQEHRTEFTRQDAFRQGRFFTFKTRKEAMDFAHKNGGMFSWSKEGTYYVFPKEFEGFSGQVTWMDED